MSGRRPWQHKAIEDNPELSKRVGDRRFDPPEPKEEAMRIKRARRRLRSSRQFTVLLTVLNVAAALSVFYETTAAGLIGMALTFPMIVTLAWTTIPKDRRELQLAQQEGE